MYVYRIEKDGFGPYFENKLDYSWTRRAACHILTDTKHPTAFNDAFSENQKKEIIILLDNNQGFFGFTSIKQLKAWFTAWEIRNLQSMGFEVVCVKASKVIHAPEAKQCVFLRDETEPKQVIEIF